MKIKHFKKQNNFSKILIEKYNLNCLYVSDNERSTIITLQHSDSSNQMLEQMAKDYEKNNAVLIRGKKFTHLSFDIDGILISIKMSVTPIL